MIPLRPSDRIQSDAVISLAQRMVRIPSQYSEDGLIEHGEIVSFLTQHLDEMGLEVEVLAPVPEFPCVVGRLRGGPGPVVAFLGHYNTVPVGDRQEWRHDPFGADIVDGKIYGRGTDDQKGGLACILEAARALKESLLPLKGDLMILFVPGEGSTEICMEKVVQNTPDRVRADYYIDTDEGAQRIAIAYGGWVWIEIVTRGRAGHPAITLAGVTPLNPVHHMIRVLNRVLEPSTYMSFSRHPLFCPTYDRYSDDPIVEVTRFQGGPKVNQIPEVCTAQVDIRMLPGQTAEGVVDELRRLFAGLGQEISELDVSLRVIRSSQNRNQVQPDHPVIQQIQAACAEMGMPIPGITGSTNGGRASLATLGPVLHFGPDCGGNTHAPNEYAYVSRIIDGARVYAHLMARLLT